MSTENAAPQRPRSAKSYSYVSSQLIVFSSYCPKRCCTISLQGFAGNVVFVLLLWALISWRQTLPETALLQVSRPVPRPVRNLVLSHSLTFIYSFLPVFNFAYFTMRSLQHPSYVEWPRIYIKCQPADVCLVEHRTCSLFHVDCTLQFENFLTTNKYIDPKSERGGYFT